MDIDDNGQETSLNETEENDRITGLSRQGEARENKKKRRVSFPDDECLVSKSVEPVDPWANSCNVTSTEVIKAYMSSCARLRVKPIDKLVKQLKDYDIFHSRINILDLKGIKLDIRSSEALEEIFKRIQVHTLDIENTNLEDEAAIAIIEMIEFYHSAVHICIGHNPRIKTRGWQIFSQMVRKAPFVEFIDLRHCCFNDPCMAVMARALKLNTTLRILHLEGDNLSGKLLLILCTGMKFNQSITELFLGDNFLAPSDASILSAMLKSNGTLQLLDVRNNMLQDQGVVQLCDGLSHQKSSGVKTLVLWNNQISKHAMIPVANLLAFTLNIQTLNIGHNRLGNEGIRNLQIGLLKNRSLLRLGLLNTKITAEGAVALAEYIADTHTLLRLDLRENDLFVGGLMALTLAVKINKSVIRIDLDKDLKKEQGMEGTQTALLVDIYQYLERNKKLGLEEEQHNKLELEKLSDVITLRNNVAPSNDVLPSDDVTLNGDVTESNDGTVGDAITPNNDGTSRYDVTPSDDSVNEFSQLVDHVENESIEKVSSSDIVEYCGHHEISRFIISLVEDEEASLEKKPDHEETKTVLNQEHIEESTEVEKEFDELLGNVKIEIPNLPGRDENEFWSKDKNDILNTS